MASKQIGHNEIDMLHGPLFMKILLFALPLAASSVLQQLFNSVDVAVPTQSSPTISGRMTGKRYAVR